MGPAPDSLSFPRPRSEEELAEWEEVYATVEAYLLSLRLHNRLLLAELVRGILARTAARRAAEPGRPLRELALAETFGVIAHWTGRVLELDIDPTQLDQRGRLALLLTGMEKRWQPLFLTDPPWPAEFVHSMSRSWLDRAPAVARLAMQPKTLELNAIGTGAAFWTESMNRRPIIRNLVAVLLLASLLLALWFLTQ